MRAFPRTPLNNNGFFVLHTDEWLDRQRQAGKIAASILSHLASLVREKKSHSLLEFDAMAENMVVDAGAKPTFKGYKGFPATLCTSVNEQLVHGIPSEYRLQEGDLVTFDIGVTFDGAIADTAVTCIYGNPKHDWHVKLVKSTEEALYKAIAAMNVGKRLGVIGDAIHKSAKGNSFNVITKYGGHGIVCDDGGKEVLHSPPFVENKSDKNTGFRMQPGLVLAIEPMLTVGSTETTIDKDDWTVNTVGTSSHAEHTVFLHDNYVEVITKRDDENQI